MNTPDAALGAYLAADPGGQPCDADRPEQRVLPSVGVVHVCPSLDVSYGGPAVAIPEIAAALQALGFKNMLVSVDGPDAKNALITERRLEWRRARPLSVRKGYAAASLVREIDRAVADTGAQIVHVHSFWCWPMIAAATVARRRRIAFAISPHSEFYPESTNRSGVLKRVFHTSIGRSRLRRASLVHGTEQREVDGAVALGYAGRSVVAQIGVDPCLGDQLPDKASARSRLGLHAEAPTALFLARLHPRKGVDRLLTAWRDGGMPDRGWRLVVAGGGEAAYVAQLKAQARALGLENEVHWLGHVDGQVRQDAFGAADLFVLPTLFENFGLSIAEALACRIPVITTDGAPWATIAQQGAGWITPAGDTHELAGALTAAASEHSTGGLAARGAAGRDLVQGLTWDKTASKLAAAYMEILNGSPRGELLNGA